MTTCAVCKKEYDIEKELCPVCGFKAPYIIGDLSKEEAITRKKAGMYVKKICQNIQIGFISKKWEKRGDTYICTGEVEKYITPKGLTSEVQWYGQSFARSAKGNSVEVTLVIRQGAEKKKMKVAISVPQEPLFWRIGASVGEELALQIHVKNKQSEEVTSIGSLLKLK